MVRSEPPPSRGRDTSGSEAASTVFYLAPLSLPPSLHFEGKETVVVLYYETEVYYPLSSSWDFSFSAAVDLGFACTRLVLAKPRLQVSWVLAFWSVLAKTRLQVSLTVCALVILI
uniref:Uncharacterized protein n=1 Tax=Zea mays TaxID=4577 RepID=B6TZI5_MAIZE|nr:hypothetical protein [Zea mays]